MEWQIWNATDECPGSLENFSKEEALKFVDTFATKDKELVIMPDILGSLESNHYDRYHAWVQK